MSEKDICTETLFSFAKSIELYFQGCLSIDKIAESFLNSIANDKSDCKKFISQLGEVKIMLDKDLEFFLSSDPAADSKEEIIKAYPGYRANLYHRVVHVLSNLGYKVEARIISEYAHFLTGIDIHPSAVIGCPFFIDHGTGIVVGETAVVGDYVKIYQGVTLGSLSLSKGSSLKGIKRHPTIGDHVTIYSGASILGDITIGDNVTIGSNVFLLKSVPSDTKVVLSEPELVYLKK